MQTRYYQSAPRLLCFYPRQPMPSKIARLSDANQAAWRRKITGCTLMLGRHPMHAGTTTHSSSHCHRRERDPRCSAWSMPNNRTCIADEGPRTQRPRDKAQGEYDTSIAQLCGLQAITKRAFSIEKGRSDLVPRHRNESRDTHSQMLDLLLVALETSWWC